MSLNIQYGMITIHLEQDSEGFACSCPLCHQMFFTTGGSDVARIVVQEHLQQYHRISLPAAVITEDTVEPPKIHLQPPPINFTTHS